MYWFMSWSNKTLNLKPYLLIQSHILFKFNEFQWSCSKNMTDDQYAPVIWDCYIFSVKHMYCDCEHIYILSVSPSVEFSGQEKEKISRWISKVETQGDWLWLQVSHIFKPRLDSEENELDGCLTRKPMADYLDVGSVFRFESFRALKLSEYESFRDLKPTRFESFRALKLTTPESFRALQFKKVRYDLKLDIPDFKMNSFYLAISSDTHQAIHLT